MRSNGPLVAKSNRQPEDFGEDHGAAKTGQRGDIAATQRCSGSQISGIYADSRPELAKMLLNPGVELTEVAADRRFEMAQVPLHSFLK